VGSKGTLVYMTEVIPLTPVPLFGPDDYDSFRFEEGWLIIQKFIDGVLQEELWMQ